jgi:hypothetical protein
MFKETDLRTTKQFFDRYTLLNFQFEKEGRDLKELILILTDSVKDRIEKESGIQVGSYRLAPNYLHTYTTQKEREVLEVNCGFINNSMPGTITPDSARAALDINTKELLICEVSYREVTRDDFPL